MAILSIEISTEYQVSQPAPFSNGQTAVVPQTPLEAKDDKTKRIELSEGASVEQLVNGSAGHWRHRTRRGCDSAGHQGSGRAAG